MAVFKIHKDDNYTVMSNTHLKDNRLSLKAKGLLSVMLSLPENWDYSINGLVAICNQEKEHAVRSALTELKECGYVEIKKFHINGRYQYEYNVYEVPNELIQGQELQDVENQDVEFQGLENHHLYKYTNKLNTNKLNTKYNNTQKSLLPKKSSSSKDRIKTLFDMASSFNFGRTDAIRIVLNDFINNSIQLKKTLTVLSFQNQLNMLKNFSDDEIIDIVKKTITRGWINVEYVIKNEYNSSFDNTNSKNEVHVKKLSNREF